jgi:predicted transglutaminase-like cysteine proteinase
MSNSGALPKRQTGILTQLKAFFDRGRLGELLVVKGLITPSELRHALIEQKHSKLPLGKVLLQSDIISRHQLARILACQSVLRFTTALVMFALSFSTFALKKARAEGIKDVPAMISFNVAAAGTYAPVDAYPGLFGTAEKRSGSLGPFTKWSGMFSRFEKQLNTSSGQQTVKAMQIRMESFKKLPLKSMASAVNKMMNEKPYIIDNKNWGKSDYWSTPVEFMQRGGDCEDFAIAKYTALRALGVPEERMRVVIVTDTYKNIPHAILALYTDDGVYVLDNQIKSLVDAGGAGRYKPIFSINRNAWWLHTTPASTQVASR